MADRIIFVCILLLAGIYFWATQQIPTLEIGDPLGPKAFPRLLGIGLLITAAMLLAEIIRDRKAVKKPSASSEKDDGNSNVVIAAVVATAIFFMSFETIGYIISVSVYLIAMMNFFNKKGRWLVNNLTAVVYGVGSYFIFTKALGVNLPRGILPF
jgi:putative tricarboxylic transport membrane protein